MVLTKERRSELRWGVIIISVLVLIAVGVQTSTLLHERREIERAAEIQVVMRELNVLGVTIEDQIPEDEIVNLERYEASTRFVKDFANEGPRYALWDYRAKLKEDGPRLPRDVADDLDPWLRKTGWKRGAKLGGPQRPGWEERSYYQDDYSMFMDFTTDFSVEGRKFRMLIRSQTVE